GHSHVLPPELRHPDGALGVLNRLTQKAAMRLRKQGFYATAMSISVRRGSRYHTASGRAESISRDTQFGEMQDTGFFLEVLHQLWHSGLQDLRHPVMVNVTLAGLVLATQHTPSLFDAPGDAPPPGADASGPRQNHGGVDARRDRAKLDAAMDKVNRTYGKNSLYFASAHDARDTAPMRIAFNRIPDVETEA
ncbi:MAG: hypothetical protein EOO54_27870, partial [Haliea sp.]